LINSSASQTAISSGLLVFGCSVWFDLFSISGFNSTLLSSIFAFQQLAKVSKNNAKRQKLFSILINLTSKTERTNPQIATKFKKSPISRG
jgi:hypothetical protein